VWPAGQAHPPWTGWLSADTARQLTR
jgi:hypothetical protein